MGLLIAIVLSFAFAGLLLWMIWPVRTGAVAKGEKGNDGLIPSDGGPGGPGRHRIRPVNEPMGLGVGCS